MRLGVHRPPQRRKANACQSHPHRKAGVRRPVCRSPALTLKSRTFHAHANKKAANYETGSRPRRAPVFTLRKEVFPVSIWHFEALALCQYQKTSRQAGTLSCYLQVKTPVTVFLDTVPLCRHASQIQSFSPRQQDAPYVVRKHNDL